MYMTIGRVRIEKEINNNNNNNKIENLLQHKMRANEEVTCINRYLSPFNGNC